MNGLTSLMVIVSGAIGAGDWSDNYGDAVKIAKSANKPLLIVLDKPEYEVKHLNASWKDTNNELLANYTLCRIDVSTEYGQRVAKAFKVSEFPHTAVLNKGCSHIIYRKSGQFTTVGWVKTLSDLRTGARPVAVKQSRICFT